jgi:hypothetical protein
LAVRAAGYGWLVAAVLLLPLAPQAAVRDGFYFGMPLASADALLQDTTDYELAYRVDTPSTADVFVRFRQHTLYLGHFLNGECCSVEKRAIVGADDMQRMFDAYLARLGTPTESADSTDGRTHYAKWAWRDRVLELSANARTDGAYLLAHEEYDPERSREAVLLQQRELREMPQQADPLTGQPLPLSRQPEQQAAAANDASPGDPVWEEAAPAADGQAAGEQDEDEADTQDGKVDKDGKDGKDKDAPPPQITGKNDWD